MIYLNNAATTYPKPETVAQAVYKAINSAPPSIHRGGADDDSISSVRSLIADFFGIRDKNRLVFTSGSTEALNLVIKGYLKEGSHAVTTAIDHNSVLRPLHHLQQKEIVDLTIVDCDEFGYVEPEKIGSAIQDNTSLVVINHCSNVTGTVQDISTIVEIAHSKNVKVLLDASQSAGHVDINVGELGVDFIAFTGHKSLYGLQGIGGLYVAESVSPEPLKTGGTGSRSTYLFQPEELPDYYEAGTPNTIGIIALGEGVKFVKSIGMEQIRSHKALMLERAIEKIKSLEGVRIIAHPSRNSNSVLCFTMDNFTPEEVAYILESSEGIKIRAGLHCAPLIHKYIGTSQYGTLRMSPSLFTKEEEIDKFIEAIEKISKS